MLYFLMLVGGPAIEALRSRKHVIRHNAFGSELMIGVVPVDSLQRYVRKLRQPTRPCHASSKL
jgi:hypothetical protein